MWPLLNMLRKHSLWWRIVTTWLLQRWHGDIFKNSSFGVKRRVVRAEENQDPRKRLCKTLSSADNSIIVLLFACLVLSVLTEKSTNYMRGLYDYAITPSRTFEQTRKYSAANDWDFLMYVQLSSCVQGAHYEWDTYAKKYRIYYKPEGSR